MSDANPFDDLAEDTEEIAEDTEDADEDTDENAGDDSRSNIDPQTTSQEPKTDVEPVMTEPGSTRTERIEPGSTRTEKIERESRSRVEGVKRESRSSEVEGPTLENSSPPFPYSDAEQRQMYVQNGLWKEFEDLGFDAELELRRTFGVRNVEQRELDTAIIRLVLDQVTPTEIAKMVIKMRGFNSSTRSS